MRRQRGSGNAYSPEIKSIKKTDISDQGDNDRFNSTPSISSNSSRATSEMHRRMSGTGESPKRSSSLDHTVTTYGARSNDVVTQKYAALTDQSERTEALVTTLLGELRDLRKERQTRISPSPPSRRGSKNSQDLHAIPLPPTRRGSKNSQDLHEIPLPPSRRGSKNFQDLHAIPLPKAANFSSSSSSSPSSSSPPSSTRAEDKAWARLHSPATGRYFYLNLGTRAVEWEATECENGWECFAIPSSNSKSGLKRAWLQQGASAVVLEEPPHARQQATPAAASGGHHSHTNKQQPQQSRTGPASLSQSRHPRGNSDSSCGGSVGAGLEVAVPQPQGTELDEATTSLARSGTHDEQHDGGPSAWLQRRREDGVAGGSEEKVQKRSQEKEAAGKKEGLQQQQQRSSSSSSSSSAVRWAPPPLGNVNGDGMSEREAEKHADRAAATIALMRLEEGHDDHGAAETGGGGGGGTNEGARGRGSAGPSRSLSPPSSPSSPVPFFRASSSSFFRTPSGGGSEACNEGGAKNEEAQQSSGGGQQERPQKGQAPKRRSGSLTASMLLAVSVAPPASPPKRMPPLRRSKSRTQNPYQIQIQHHQKEQPGNAAAALAQVKEVEAPLPSDTSGQAKSLNPLSNHSNHHHRRRHRLMLLPDGTVRLLWDFFAVLPCVAYLALLTPFFACFAFDPNRRHHPHLLGLEAAIDVVFLGDVFLNFRTGFVQHDSGLVVLAWRRVGKRYLASLWFPVDVASALPFSLLDFLFALSSSSSSHGREGTTSWLGTVKALRVVRLLKLSKLLRTASLFNGLYLDTATKDWLIDLRFSYGGSIPVKFGQVLVLMALLSHYFGCAWVYVGRVGAKRGEPNWLETAMLHLPPRHHKGNEGAGEGADDLALGSGYEFHLADTKHGGRVGSLYLAAVYYCMTTMTSVGYGDLSPTNDRERLFAMLLEGMGCVMYALIVATLTSVMMTKDANERAMAEKLGNVSSYVNHRGFHPQLARRLRLYFRHFYGQRMALDEQHILSELSQGLRQEVSTFLVSELMERVSFFRSLSPSYWSSMLPLLRPCIFTLDEVVCFEGAECLDMYVLLVGEFRGTTTGQMSSAVNQPSPQLQLSVPPKALSNCVDEHRGDSSAAANNSDSWSSAVSSANAPPVPRQQVRRASLSSSNLSPDSLTHKMRRAATVQKYLAKHHGGNGNDNGSGQGTDGAAYVRAVAPGGTVNSLCCLGVWPRCVETVVSVEPVSEGYSVRADDFQRLFNQDEDKALLEAMQVRTVVTAFAMVPDDTAPTKWGMPVLQLDASEMSQREAKFEAKIAQQQKKRRSRLQDAIHAHHQQSSTPSSPAAAAAASHPATSRGGCVGEDSARTANAATATRKSTAVHSPTPAPLGSVEFRPNSGSSASPVVAVAEAARAPGGRQQHPDDDDDDEKGFLRKPSNNVDDGVYASTVPPES